MELTLFDDYVAPRAEAPNARWTKAETAYTKQNAEWRAYWDLDNWEEKAAIIAEKLGWAEYEANLTLLGVGTIKRLDVRGFRFEKNYSPSLICSHYKLHARAGKTGYCIGVDLYPDGRIVTSYCPPEFPKDEEHRINGGFIRALYELTLVGIIKVPPSVLREQIYDLTATERLEYMLREREAGFEVSP